MTNNMTYNTSVSRYVRLGTEVEAKYIDSEDDEYRWFQGLVKRIRKYNNDNYGRYVECDVLYDDGEYVKCERFYDCDYGDDVWRFSSHLAPLVQNLLGKIDELEYQQYFEDDESYETSEDECDDSEDDVIDDDDEENGDEENGDEDNDDSDDENNNEESSQTGEDGEDVNDSAYSSDEEDANQVIKDVQDVVRHVNKTHKRVVSFMKVMFAFTCAAVTTVLLYKTHPKCYHTCAFV